MLTAVSSHWADESSDVGADLKHVETEDVRATDEDEEKEPKNETVEYRVPEGGYLTDPAIAQDKPRSSALNRIFPLWKSEPRPTRFPRDPPRSSTMG